MSSRLNCQQIVTRIKEIKSKEADFNQELANGNFEICLNLKSELTKLIAKLNKEIWTFNQKELSREKLQASYEQYKTLFEQNGIVRDGYLAPELIPEELSGEKFKMPTLEEFLDFIKSRETQVIEMIKLGLVEPVLVPIAADFGKDETVYQPGFHRYTGLVKVLAEKLRQLGLTNKLKTSDGKLLPVNPKWKNCSINYDDPVYPRGVYKDLLYSFKDKNGEFHESLSQKQFIQKHREAGSPFPGFAIYFQEKGVSLPRTRNDEDPLSEMTSGRSYLQYKQSLRNLGLTGTTAHVELITLLASLQKDGKMRRDCDNSSDACTFLGGISFPSTTSLGDCLFDKPDGRFCFYISTPDYSDSNVACAPVGELV